MECVSKERKNNSAFACLAARYKKIENKISDIFLTQVKSSIFAPAFKEAFLLKADSVAQLVEHYTFNVVVMGSNPIGITGMKRNPIVNQYFTVGFFIWGKHRVNISEITDKSI